MTTWPDLGVASEGAASPTQIWEFGVGSFPDPNLGVWSGQLPRPKCGSLTKQGKFHFRRLCRILMAKTVLRFCLLSHFFNLLAVVLELVTTLLRSLNQASIIWYTCVTSAFARVTPCLH